ncbi:MAG: SGNH/GDSL hydrolase family protein [Planctomycetota bacterium]|jgi:hypothetical protein
MTRLRLFAARALAIVLGAGTAGLAGELVARARFEAPLPERLPLLEVQANLQRGWEMVPGQDHFTYHHPVQVNALGLRGPELEAKRPGEFRVLALGDSLVYGQGVAGDQTLPFHLEQVLDERLERSVTVVNGGLRAYSTVQELGLLRELGTAVDPDLVVLFWYWNDIDWIDPVPYAERLEQIDPIAFDLRAKPEGWPLFKWRVKQLLRRSVLLMVVHDTLRDSTQELEWLARADERLAALPGQLEEFRSLSEALGARFVVCAIPKASSLAGEDMSTPIVRRAIETCAAAGIELRLLDEELRRTMSTSGRLPLVPYDGHYDGAGNRALATDAALWLAESGALDDPVGDAGE